MWQVIDKYFLKTGMHHLLKSFPDIKDSDYEYVNTL